MDAGWSQAYATHSKLNGLRNSTTALKAQANVPALAFRPLRSGPCVSCSCLLFYVPCSCLVFTFPVRGGGHSPTEMIRKVVHSNPLSMAQALKPGKRPRLITFLWVRACPHPFAGALNPGRSPDRVS